MSSTAPHHSLDQVAQFHSRRRSRHHAGVLFVALWAALVVAVSLGGCDPGANPGAEVDPGGESSEPGSGETAAPTEQDSDGESDGEVAEDAPTEAGPIPWNLERPQSVRVRLDSSWNGREASSDETSETAVTLIGRADQMARMSLVAGAYDETFDVGPDQVRVRISDEWMTFVNVSDFENSPTERPGNDPAEWTCNRAADATTAGNGTCVEATLTCTRLGEGMVRELQHRGTFCDESGWSSLVRHALLEGGGQRTVRLDVVEVE